MGTKLLVSTDHKFVDEKTLSFFSHKTVQGIPPFLKEILFEIFSLSVTRVCVSMCVDICVCPINLFGKPLTIMQTVSWQMENVK